MGERRKVSTALAAFEAELHRLTRLDDLNQSRFFPGPGRPGATRLSPSQMHLLTEAIFARAFSRYEMYMEEVFLGLESRRGTYRIPAEPRSHL